MTITLKRRKDGLPNAVLEDGSVLVSSWAVARDVPEIILLNNECITDPVEGEARPGWIWTPEQFAQKLQATLDPAVMVFRTHHYGKLDCSGNISAMIIYHLVSRNGGLCADIITWCVDPELSPSVQKMVMHGVFCIIEDKLPHPTEKIIWSLVSARDLWRQILLRDCGFVCYESVGDDFLKFVRVTL